MGNKDYDASWYMCETKDSIRVLMVLYAFVTFLAMVAEATSTVVTAKNTDYHRRPYVWIMGATYTSLRFLTLIVIVYWIVAATNVSRSQISAEDHMTSLPCGIQLQWQNIRTNIRGMRMAFNIVFVRVIGNLVYNVAYFATDIFLIPDTLSRRYRMIIHPDMIPKDAALLSVLAWTVLEVSLARQCCLMLDRMNQYEMHGVPKGSATSAQALSPSYAPSPTSPLSPTIQKLQSPKASRVISPAVPSPTTPRLRSGGDVSRAASPAVVTSPPKGVKARPSEWVAPSRVGSPTRGRAYRVAGVSHVGTDREYLAAASWACWTAHCWSARSELLRDLSHLLELESGGVVHSQSMRASVAVCPHAGHVSLAGVCMRIINVKRGKVWDNLRLMIFSSTAILGRLTATILHAFTPGSIDLYSASFKADAYQLIALHPEEVAFVSPLIVYQQGFYMRKEREAVVASDEVHAQAQTSTGHREHSGDDYSDELSIEADGDRPAMSSDLPTASSGYTGSDKK
ncbi:hypothetical protein HPB51_004957 [Rhipicephalus microplus]|uniref:Uncharacterized protein n=1 Tax=Rhipicephalus microplus TaxID=6941 RepID=A0A9J6EYI4_RHIMP|nr:hypothetical protein HPB51_004957 [Rhipicephalus microplus]